MPGWGLAGGEAGQGLRHGLPYGFERAGGLRSTASLLPPLPVHPAGPRQFPSPWERGERKRRWLRAPACPGGSREGRVGAGSPGLAAVGGHLDRAGEQPREWLEQMV